MIANNRAEAFDDEKILTIGPLIYGAEFYRFGDPSPRTGERVLGLQRYFKLLPHEPIVVAAVLAPLTVLLAVGWVACTRRRSNQRVSA